MIFDPGNGLFGEQWNAFDNDGVLYKGLYNPVSIAQYGLYCHGLSAEGNAQAHDAFLRQARYLRDKQHADGTYRYTFAHPSYGLAPGWISSLAQAEAASLLFRAYASTREEAYLHTALRALEPFTRDISNGGVTFFRGRDVFFEEYAGCPTHILPGHILSAYAIWEATRYRFAAKDLEDIHEAAVATLLRWLPLYDAGGWSFYQLAVRNGVRHYAPITYHQTNIALLSVYSSMTGRDEFAKMSANWRAGLGRWDVRARVWRDSLAWITERIAVRSARTSSPAWEPMAVPAAKYAQ